MGITESCADAPELVIPIAAQCHDGDMPRNLHRQRGRPRSEAFRDAHAEGVRVWVGLQDAPRGRPDPPKEEENEGNPEHETPNAEPHSQ